MSSIHRAPVSAAGLLAISSLSEDHVWLQRVLDPAVWHVQPARTGREAMGLLRANHPAVVLCDEHLPDCSWRGILSELARIVHPPPLVVTSRLADDRLWAEVLNLGGYDLLMKPFDYTEVVRVLHLAQHSCRGASQTSTLRAGM